MPVTTEIEENKSGSFPVLPEDFYQVVVKDFYDKDMQKYNAAPGVIENKYIIKLVVLNEGESKGFTIVDFITRSWFNELGKKNKKGEAITPSKLVNIFKAFYGYYNPKINVYDMSKPSIEMVNELIGKQVRIAVKVKGEGDEAKNKITDYMVIKEELDVPSDIEVAKVGEVKTSTPISEKQEASEDAKAQPKEERLNEQPKQEQLQEQPKEEFISGLQSDKEGSEDNTEGS